MTSLKKSGLLRTYYRDRLRGYRLGAKAKAALLDGWPERFSPYLTGDTDTNRLKSEVNRRLRLHRLAETYITMRGLGSFRMKSRRFFRRRAIVAKLSNIPPFTVPVKSRKWESTPRRFAAPGLQGCFLRPPAFLSPTTAALP